MPGNPCDACCCFQCVEEMDAGIIENLGKFDRVAGAGFHCVFYPLESIVHRMSLKVCLAISIRGFS